MASMALTIVIGAACICYQVFAAEDVYVAELMVESNITLDADTILSALSSSDLQVTDSTGASHQVTLVQKDLVAECRIVGEQTSCTCSDGYIWSNNVCSTFGCCRESKCAQNVSHVTPLCIAKVQVTLNGTVELNGTTWDSAKTTQLETAFQQLNGFTYLNVISQSQSSAEFEVGLTVKFASTALEDVLSSLETSLGAALWVVSSGMVTMESPTATVCHLSEPRLQCSFEEATDGGGWSIIRASDKLDLNNGSVVKLDHGCATPEQPSCVAVTLRNVTGLWAGTYECGFRRGSVTHTATAQLKVALLPEHISMTIEPLTVDCSARASTDSVAVDVTATIQDTVESFEVWWSYNGAGKNHVANTSFEDDLRYDFQVLIGCQQTDAAHYVTVTFQNRKLQENGARVDIPVIYAGVKFCSEEMLDGQLWPKAPAGDTVINKTCAEGRVGSKSRTCEGATWQPVFSQCVSEELNKVSNSADNFLKGMGATQETAMEIFGGLKNSSSAESDLSDSMADLSASVSIMHVMAEASENVVLQDTVLPEFVDAASRMLNKTWGGVNSSVIQHMSSNYLQSVESLVKNIKVNQSSGVNSANLDLKFCSSKDCNMSVFDIDVNMSMTTGIMKTVGVKNLMDKLKNNFDEMVTSSILVSATLEDHNGSTLEIQLNFPKEQLGHKKPLCVFWNTTGGEWSDQGCAVRTHDGNRTLCECNHLTSFSVLMAKEDISTESLDLITNVGLGVSVCSLVIFLFIESLVWSAVVKTNLSHYRHTAMVNIAMFLLLADCSFLASSSPDILTDNWCLILTICKHLFFLAMFSWMLCMSVMLVHQLIFVFSPLRKRVFMFLSSIVGYVCPVLIVGSSYVYYRYTNKPYHDKTTCWLVFEKLLEGSVHAFFLPVGAVILTNLFSMVVVIVTLVKTSVPDGSKADEKETAKSILKVVLFLTPVFGVTWTIGFFLLLLDTDHPMFPVANYSFTILNSFQGFFILITGCFAEQKVREELLNLIRAKTKGQSESTKNSTSTTYTKAK